MTLLALLERLALPEVLSERLEQTRTDLVAAPADDALDANVAQIAELINEGRRLSLAEKHAVEGFLKELTDRLQDLDRGLTATGASREQAQQRRRDFDEHLRDQVRTIGSSVEGALDLDALKAQVAERVDAIELHMTEFRRHDTEREREAEEEIRVLTERLQSLERETGGLRARLQHERAQALLDPLTQVPNRLAYEERLAAEYLRFKRYRRPLVLAVVDIDLFKRINDGYGHKAGDRVLQIVARLLAEGLRETDFVGRYGGEEFALLMPETRAQDAVAVLDKLRLQIAEAETHFHGTPVRVSVSCGVAEIAPEDSEASLFERADRALYRAKQGGRNRCELG
jgi:diguanylate cyclase